MRKIMIVGCGGVGIATEIAHQLAQHNVQVVVTPQDVKNQMQNDWNERQSRQFDVEEMFPKVMPSYHYEHNQRRGKGKGKGLNKFGPIDVTRSRFHK